MLRKVITLICCLSMVFTFASCGDINSKVNISTSGTSNPTSYKAEMKVAQPEPTKAPTKPSDKITYDFIIQGLKDLEKAESKPENTFVKKYFLELDKDSNINNQLQDVIIAQMKLAYNTEKEPKFDEAYIGAYKKALKVQADNELTAYKKQLDEELAKKDAEVAASEERVKKSKEAADQAEAEANRIEEENKRLDQIGAALKSNN